MSETETKVAEVWMHSTDEERWSDYEEYPTREAAIAGAQYYHGMQEGDRYWVGRKAEVDLRRLARGAVDASVIVQGLSEQAGEEVGEVSGEWPDASREDEADLEAALAEAIAAWIERRGLTPSFYRLVDVTEHEAPAACEGCVTDEAAATPDGEPC